MLLNVIFAVSENYDFCTSDRFSLPWGRIQEDLNFFKKKTTGKNELPTINKNVIIMGKNTFSSLGHSPLKDRINIVVSRTIKNTQEYILNPPQNYYVACNLYEAIKLATVFSPDETFIIGGISLIEEAFERFYINNVYINIIGGSVLNNIEPTKSIKFMYKLPPYLMSNLDVNISVKDDYNIKYMHYSSEIGCKDEVYKQESQYIELLKYILENGEKREDRTGTGTLSCFGKTIKFNVSEEFPLLTTKRVYWKGVVEELLWFLSGSSDSKILEKKGINIWKGNTSREFLDNMGLKKYREGELGPAYGWQWRSFNKLYIPLNEQKQLELNGFIDCRETGIDQIKEAIKLINNDPTSRRILVSAWNPSQLKEMCLPPCHFCFEFFVSGDKLEKLSILVNMRSCDTFLGLPFNIASYSLLLYMISHITNKQPHEVIFMLGDTHIYLNHIEQVKEQISREIRSLPTLKIKRTVFDIDEFKFEDFELENYSPHSTIKAEMAV